MSWCDLQKKSLQVEILSFHSIEKIKKRAYLQRKEKSMFVCKDDQANEQ